MKTPAPNSEKKATTFASLRKLFALLTEEKGRFALSLLALLFTSVLSLATPWVFGRAIDTSVAAHDYPGVLRACLVLFAMSVLTFGASYLQMRLMGGIGQTVLFRLRQRLFEKLQALPIAFFNENKTGDLISRVNGDTDKLSQFFSETLVRFMGSLVLILGTAIFLLALHPRLGAVALIPALVLFLLTRVLSPWVKQRNARSLASVGNLSAEIQESLAHFKVIVAFHRRDYFQQRFQKTNEENYSASLRAGIANTVFTPLYDLASSSAQLAVLAYGLFLITRGQLTLGLFLSFFLYLDRFYSPLRQIAMLWSSFQLAFASWDRIAAILDYPAALPIVKGSSSKTSSPLLEFRSVDFQYPNGAIVLKHLSLTLETGKTYALVGPTGGGKTTTASLMARLYDPTNGLVLFRGRDLRSYPAETRTKEIGFILQEPFLFMGTLLSNLFYGHPTYGHASAATQKKHLQKQGFDTLLQRFDQGLETPVDPTKDTLSLGQKQLIAFMRAVLREPSLLILDEATANIDTVTEQLLEDILQRLPKETTKVIIAHRLNTIENADEIFFVNNGEVRAAGSWQQAVDLLLHQKRTS